MSRAGGGDVETAEGGGGLERERLCPYRFSISRDSTCLQNGTDGLDGRTCLISIRISGCFRPVCNSTTKHEERLGEKWGGVDG